MKKALALFALLSIFNLSSNPTRLEVVRSVATLSSVIGRNGFRRLSTSTELLVRVTVYRSSVLWECSGHEAAERLAQDHFYVQDEDIVWYGKEAD